MEENSQKMHEEELNFLKEELKRIDVEIKRMQYGGSVQLVEAQIKLWELREKVMKEISKFVDIYFAKYKEEN
jgi:glutathionyl-hydroquinone reductase